LRRGCVQLPRLAFSAILGKPAGVDPEQDACAPPPALLLDVETAWSSLVHAVIMAVQAAQDSAESGHFIADIPALALVFLVLLWLGPRKVFA